MKKKGFTLIEMMIVMAIMGIIMMMIVPMTNAFVGAEKMMEKQSELDFKLNIIVNFLKKDVKSGVVNSNLGGKVIGVFDSDDNLITTDGNIGTTIVIYAPNNDNELDDEKKYPLNNVNIEKHYIRYKLEGTELKVDTNTDFASLSSGSTILTGIKTLEFKYINNMLKFYIELDIPEESKNKLGNKIRDIAITNFD